MQALPRHTSTADALYSPFATPAPTPRQEKPESERGLYRAASERVKEERAPLLRFDRDTRRKKKGPPVRAGLSRGSRQRPTLPRSCPRSTIGAERLNDRVRNGNGCGPLAMVTGKLNSQVDAYYAAPRFE